MVSLHCLLYMSDEGTYHAGHVLNQLIIRSHILSSTKPSCMGTVQSHYRTSCCRGFDLEHHASTSIRTLPIP